MQENINIPDSEITTNLTFRQLVLMNMQQLTNFPYIEKDFDALTDYELLCLVVKYLNDVISNQNEQNDSITRMYNSFLALQDYVNNTKDELETAFNNLDDYVRNYFANLDVQEEINNKLDEMVEDGTLQDILVNYLKIGYVSAYGGIDNEDLTTVITSMINTYNINYIFCDVSGYLENITLTSENNVIIDFMGNTIKITGKYAEYNIFENSGKLTLLNGTFDCGNTNSCTVLRGINGSYNIIDKCNFINFKETTNTRQTHPIYVYTGSYTKITNCHFENITQVGNGTIGDYGGSASCILSQFDSENPTTNETSLIVDSCSFKNNWNTNAQNEIIIEDFDNIKVQNIQQTSGVDNYVDKDMFIFTNITSYNSGKRVIKAQTDNVTIDNINCICDDFTILCVVSLFHKNHNVSNIFGKIKGSSGIELLNVENANITNVNISNESLNDDSIFKSGIIINRSSNINFNNININNFAIGLGIWDSNNNISFSDCNIHGTYRGLYIYTRTTSSYNPESGVTIDNLNFSNCQFKTDGESTDRLFDIRKINNNYIGNINFTNCLFKTLKTTYLYGTFVIQNALLVNFSNCYFNINNTSDNISNFNISGTIVKLINSYITNLNNTPKILANTDSKVYIDKSIINSNLAIASTGKMLIQYSTYNSITGNTVDNCHIDEFDMS